MKLLQLLSILLILLLHRSPFVLSFAISEGRTAYKIIRNLSSTAAATCPVRCVRCPRGGGGGAGRGGQSSRPPQPHSRRSTDASDRLSAAGQVRRAPPFSRHAESADNRRPLPPTSTNLSVGRPPVVQRLHSWLFFTLLRTGKYYPRVLFL